MCTLMQLVAGAAFTICAIVDADECAVTDFMRKLDKSERLKVLQIINRIAEHGPPNNKEKFNPEGNGIYAIKTRGGSRVYCFYGDDKKIILTHGFKKPKKKEQRRELERAEKFRSLLIADQEKRDEERSKSDA